MISLYITNKAGSGKSVSTLGNSVTINLNQPILLDEKKKYNMRLLQANIVYCSPNVYTNVNNVLSYSYNNVAKTITFDQGLYSMKTLITKFKYQLRQILMMRSFFILHLTRLHQKFMLYIIKEI